MATSSDRKDIQRLQNPPTNYRDASGSKPSPWGEGPPVPIPIPLNNKYPAMARTPKNSERTTRTRTGNPTAAFDKHLRPKTNMARVIVPSVGNITATRTFRNSASTSVSARLSDEAQRPAKRQKTGEHTSAPPAMTTPGRSALEKPKRKQDSTPIVIEDDGDEVISITQHNAAQEDTPSDPLNIPGSVRRNPFRKGPTPDGPNTKKKAAEMLIHDVDLDSIDEFTDSGSPRPNKVGYVKDQASRIDLRHQLIAKVSRPPSLKMKMKPKVQPKPDVFDVLSEPTPFFSSKIQSSQAHKEGFVLEYCYIDAQLFGSAPHDKLRMRFTQGGTVVIEDLEGSYMMESVKQFKIQYPDFRDNDCNVVQLNNISERAQPKLVTMRVDTDPESGFTTSAFTQMIREMRKIGAEVNTHSASTRIWDIAKRLAERETLEKRKSAPDRMAQLDSITKNRTHNLGPAPSGSRLAPKQGNPGKRKVDETLKDDLMSEVEEIEPAKKKMTIKKPNARSATNTPSSDGPVRRSTRQQEAKKGAKKPERNNVKDDKLILSYPQGQPGAVNITMGDLNRLEPGEFLNDTLIEFGLKYWHNQLEALNPELAGQIHVFNSFFFKKFNQKDLNTGYASVRKWTNKIDIFQKKYIIVPINEHLHWYLVVIHEPEHILSYSGPPLTPSARPNTRSAAAEVEQVLQMTAEDPEAATDITPPTPIGSEEADKQSEAEVEKQLDDEFQNSCSITEPDSRMASPSIDEDNHSDIYGDPVPTIPEVYSNEETSKKDEAPVDLLPTASIHESEAQLPGKPPPLSPKRMVIDVDSEASLVSTLAAEAEAGPSETSKDDSPASSKAVEPERFYQPAPKKPSRKGKEKAEPAPMEIDSKEDEEVLIVSDKPQTQIFTFDSLGTKHPTVIKKLATYLRMEAKDKKGIENAGLATGTFAPVPCQQNFCDCGLFLLHFAETFISDPKKYTEIILAPKGTHTSNTERGELWRQEAVVGDKGRTKMQAAIVTLSREWTRQRDEAKEQTSSEDVMEKATESDDEIEVIDVQGVQQKGKQKASSGGTSKRKIGPASRVRG